MFAFSSQRVIDGVGVWERNVHMVSHLLYRYLILAGMAVTTGAAGLAGAILEWVL